MCRDGVGLPLERQLERLGGDSVAHELQRVGAEQDLSRACRLLEPGGDVDRVAGDERVALAGHDGARVDPDPHLQAEPVHDLPQLRRRPCRAQRIVLARHRDPEHGHHGIADELLHRSAVPLEDDPSGVVVPVHQRPQRLRVRAVADCRRTGEVAEEDGHDLPHLARPEPR